MSIGSDGGGSNNNGRSSGSINGSVSPPQTKTSKVLMNQHHHHHYHHGGLDNHSSRAHDVNRSHTSSPVSPCDLGPMRCSTSQSDDHGDVDLEDASDTCSEKNSPTDKSKSSHNDDRNGGNNVNRRKKKTRYFAIN